MTKREIMMRELKQRCRALGVAPKRNLLTVEVNKFPSLHIFEDTETSLLVKPGLYRKTLPVWIEYFEQLRDMKTIYEYGNEMIDRLSAAIELDERFKTENNVSEPMDLCIEYYMTENTLVPFGDQVCDLQVRYDFVYLDKFKGYEPSRH